MSFANRILDATIDALNHEAHVWSVNLAGMSPNLVENALVTLSIHEKERASKLRFPVLRDRFILSRGILRRLLAALCHNEAAHLTFKYGEHGKPFLEEGVIPVQFSVSHSGDLAAYAATLRRPIGIDIEHHCQIPDLDEIAKRFFSPTEWRDLASLDPHDREISFLNCWVRKEAYTKALGKGFSMPFDSFCVSLTPGRPPVVLQTGDSCEEENRWATHQFFPRSDYFGAIALRDVDCVVRVHPLLSASEFYESPLLRC